MNPSFAMPDPTPSRKIMPNTMAMAKFAMTPADATKSVPHLWLLKLRSLYGTGLAQPNGKGAPDKMSMPGTRIDPIGSICLSGFSVRRPATSAVWSPKASAA